MKRLLFFVLLCLLLTVPLTVSAFAVTGKAERKTPPPITTHKANASSFFIRFI
jgi:hypothetical protein